MRATLGTALRVLQTEGSRAFRDRLLDRLAERRRRRSFRLAEVVEAGAAPWQKPAEGPIERPEQPISVLHLLPGPPRPDHGGVETQLAARLGVGESWALLYPIDRGYRLEVSSGGERWAVIYLAPPPPDLALLDGPFERVVKLAAERIRARVIHVEQIHGLPFGSLRRLGDSGLRLVLSLHDFSFFCPRPHLLEAPHERFCHFSHDAERCTRCLTHRWPVPLEFQAQRREAAAELLARASARIYPSEYLRQVCHELVPGLEGGLDEVVAPASTAPVLGSPPPGGSVRRVAYVGSVKPHKGAKVFEELVKTLDAGESIHWSAYGGGDGDFLKRWRSKLGVRVRGYYRAGSLPELLRRDRIDLVLLLSIWPETYGMTLDESWRAGVPALAFDHGAIAERIHRHGGGMLVPLEEGTAGVAERIRGLLTGELEVSFPADLDEHLPTPEGSTEAHRRIYSGLF